MAEVFSQIPPPPTPPRHDQQDAKYPTIAQGDGHAWN